MKKKLNQTNQMIVNLDFATLYPNVMGDITNSGKGYLLVMMRVNKINKIFGL